MKLNTLCRHGLFNLSLSIIPFTPLQGKRPYTQRNLPCQSDAPPAFNCFMHYCLANRQIYFGHQCLFTYNAILGHGVFIGPGKKGILIRNNYA